MVSFKRLILGTVAMIGLAGTANAAFVPASWSDEIGGTTYIGAGKSYTYSHNIKDNNFNVGSDLITNFSLSIDLFDDAKDGWLEIVEIADVDVSGWHEGIVSTFQFGADAFTSGFSLLGLLELNTQGTLTVTISSLLGDFNVGTSSLTARGYSQSPAQVPEPGTIALLGLGLLGVGLGRRKKLAQ
jgi:hypothetical protein